METLERERDRERFIRFVKQNGKAYEPADLPGTIKRSSIGDCFDCCVVNAMQTEYRYVEGIAIIDGQTFHHAWLTDGIHAFDPTWYAYYGGEKLRVPAEYIGIEMSIIAVAKFMSATKYKSIFSNGWRNPRLAEEACPGIINLIKK